jgi:S1-C subfamily serine protease
MRNEAILVTKMLSRRALNKGQKIRLYARSSMRSFYLFYLFIVLCSSASAQTVHDQIRNSLVFIEMKGFTDQGLPMASAGTGFFVSEDGYILTSYHLLEAISKVPPETVEIWISLWERKQVPDKRAFVVDARINLDLLLLKVSRMRMPYTAVKTGSARRNTSSPVFTSGFRYQESPPDAFYIKYSDQITSEDGPAGYTWTLRQDAAAGQSGSPIYTTDGTVIGVLKGVFNGQTAFVPIEHAATLLLAITLDPKGDTR